MWLINLFLYPVSADEKVDEELLVHIVVVGLWMYSDFRRIIFIQNLKLFTWTTSKIVLLMLWWKQVSFSRPEHKTKNLLLLFSIRLCTFITAEALVAGKQFRSSDEVSSPLSNYIRIKFIVCL